MRRKDREVVELKELLKIMSECEICRLAFNDGDYPYILPLNFGFKEEEGRVTLYFHSANEGYKFDVIARDNRASFEMDCRHDIYSVKERGYCTMNYSSIIGRGRVELVDDPDEKLEGLIIMTDHYHEEHFEFNHASIPRTTVYKLIVEEMRGKTKNSKR